MNWDYWKERIYQQEEAKAKWMTPLEKSGLKVITYTYPYINEYGRTIQPGSTTNTKLMRFLTKANLIEDVYFQMVN